eukprot:scaffold48_cov311-Pinguiococcus_pyrenoidosus.AAC.282
MTLRIRVDLPDMFGAVKRARFPLRSTMSFTTVSPACIPRLSLEKEPGIAIQNGATPSTLRALETPTLRQASRGRFRVPQPDAAELALDHTGLCWTRAVAADLQGIEQSPDRAVHFPLPRQSSPRFFPSVSRAAVAMVSNRARRLARGRPRGTESQRQSRTAVASKASCARTSSRRPGHSVAGRRQLDPAQPPRAVLPAERPCSHAKASGGHPMCKTGSPDRRRVRDAGQGERRVGPYRDFRTPAPQTRLQALRHRQKGCSAPLEPGRRPSTTRDDLS